MIYETLYTITVVAMAVALVFSWRTTYRLKNENFRLHCENKELEDYVKSLDGLNRSSLNQLAKNYETTNK